MAAVVPGVWAPQFRSSQRRSREQVEGGQVEGRGRGPGAALCPLLWGPLLRCLLTPLSGSGRKDAFTGKLTLPVPCGSGHPLSITRLQAHGY